MTDLNEIVQQAAMHHVSLCVCEQKYPVRQETKGYDKDQFTCCEGQIGQALIFHADSKFLSPDFGKVADASARVEILLILDYSASKSVAKETAASFQLDFTIAILQRSHR